MLLSSWIPPFLSVWNKTIATMEDRRWAVFAVIVPFQAISITSVAARLYIRHFLVRAVGWDDSM